MNCGKFGWYRASGSVEKVENVQILQWRQKNDGDINAPQWTASFDQEGSFEPSAQMS